jgi:3-oxoadipate enol-lactonase
MTIQCAFSVDGDGPPLFMIHGIGNRRQSWDRIAELMKGEFQCIRYDLRGHSESPLPDGIFGLDELVEDLEDLRRRLGVERAHFVGISLGGMIGPAYARSYPERVESLTLVNTAAFRTDDDRAKVQAVITAIETRGLEPVLDTLVTRWFTDAFVRERPDVVAARKAQLLEMNLDVFLNVFRIYAGTEMGPWLNEITAPTLVMTGELDGGCSPRLNTQIAAALPNSEYVVLDGLKHGTVAEAPERVGGLLLKFLRARLSTS